jgi:hypothetical protein
MLINPLHFEICRSELKHGKKEWQKHKHKCKHESRNVNTWNVMDQNWWNMIHIFIQAKNIKHF